MEKINFEELKELWDNDRTIKVRDLISKEELENEELNQTITLQVPLMKLIVDFIEKYTSLLGITTETFLERSVMSMVEKILKEASKLPMNEVSKFPIDAL